MIASLSRRLHNTTHLQRAALKSFARPSKNSTLSGAAIRSVYFSPGIRFFSEYNKDFVVEDAETGETVSDVFDAEEVENLGSEAIYTPKSKLDFDPDGYCLICFSSAPGNFSTIMVAYSIITGFIAAFSIYKLTQWSKRGFFGLIFYGIIGLATTYITFSNFNLMRSMIKEVKLSKSGKELLFRSYSPVMSDYLCDIKKIEAKSFIKEEEDVGTLMMGYPIKVDNKEVYLPLTMQKVRPDVLGMALNKVYINVKE